VRRIKAEAALIDLGSSAGTYGGMTTTPAPYGQVWQRWLAWRKRTGFFMDGQDGVM